MEISGNWWISSNERTWMGCDDWEKTTLRLAWHSFVKIYFNGKWLHICGIDKIRHPWWNGRNQSRCHLYQRWVCFRTLSKLWTGEIEELHWMLRKNLTNIKKHGKEPQALELVPLGVIIHFGWNPTKYEKFQKSKATFYFFFFMYLSMIKVPTLMPWWSFPWFFNVC